MVGVLPRPRFPQRLQELVGRVRDALSTAHGEVPDAFLNDEPRPGDATCQKAARLNRDDLVLGAVEDERRDADGGEDIADVEVAIHAQERLKHSRARPVAQVVEERLGLLGRVLAEPVRGLERLGPRPEDPQVVRDPALVRILGEAPGVVRCPECPRNRASKDQRCGALRIGGGEQDAHRSALGEAEEGGALRPDRVHHGPDVVHARLERGRAAHRIRHPRAALVELDQATHRDRVVECRAEARELQASSTCVTYPGTKTSSNGPSPSTW